MSPPSTPTSKGERRTQFRAYRQGLSPAAYAARSALICSRALGLPSVVDASVVHTYWPQLEEGEVDTRPLIGALRGGGTEIVLPVVTSYDPEAPEMEHRRYEGPGKMTTNRWGIREPAQTERVSPDTLEVVIVPALGAGCNGHRIGHGLGYYDAFLSGLTVPRIVLVYEQCLLPTVPADPHDIPGTAIVTERGVTQVANDTM